MSTPEADLRPCRVYAAAGGLEIFKLRGGRVIGRDELVAKGQAEAVLAYLRDLENGANS